MLRGLRIVAPCVVAVTALAGCAGSAGPERRAGARPVQTLVFEAVGTAGSQPDSAAGAMERLIRRRGLPVPELMGRARIDDRDPHVTEASPTSVVVTYLPLEAFAPGPTSPEYKIVVTFDARLACVWSSGASWSAVTGNDGRFSTPWFRGVVLADGHPVRRSVTVADARRSDSHRRPLTAPRCRRDS